MKTHNRPLQVLVVEDSENDAALLEIELQRAGYQPVCHRVEAAEAMQSALERQTWDLVIADYVMPHFNGLAALALVKERGLDLPFIIVSGHITEATAVAAMKSGAHDYVMKDNLARLGSAVERELREAEGRRHQRQAEERLRVEHSFRQAVENSVPAGIAAVDLEGRQTYVNRAFCAMLGWNESDLVGARPPFVYWPPEHREAITAALVKIAEGNGPAGGNELVFCRRTGERFNVLLQVTPLRDLFGNLTGWVSSASDIAERKRAEARLAAEHAITRILASTDSLDEAAPGIVQVLLEGLEVDFGAVWAMDLQTRILKPLTMHLRQRTRALQSFLEESRRLSLSPDTRLGGQMAQHGRAVWLEDISKESQFERKPAALRAGLQSAMVFPIQNAGKFLGFLEFFTRQRLERDPTLLNMMTAIGSEIGQFIQRRGAEEALRRAHDELETRVQQRTAELKSTNTKLETSIRDRRRLEHELLDITEKERRRIGLDLHDDLGQKLSGVALMTKGLEVKLAKQQAGEALEAAKIYTLIQQAMSHASSLARNLATLDFKEKSLPAALSDLAAHAKETFRIVCNFKAEGNIAPLDPQAARQLYQIAQEAVTNAIKHGKARRVSINLVNGSQQLLLTIQNDGLPFPDLKSSSTGMGLRIMNYRASLLGAALEVKSTGTHGTRVRCSLPLPAKGVAAVQKRA
jgi:PAS domain S-box-containing protein